jgi:hypothetical protein
MERRTSSAAPPSGSLPDRRRGRCQQVGRAVTALQFQDIVSQLARPCRRRAEAIDDVSRHLASLAQTLQRNAATRRRRASLESLRDETRRVAERLQDMADVTANCPVSQTEMNHGDVELF